MFNKYTVVCFNFINITQTHISVKSEAIIFKNKQQKFKFLSCTDLLRSLEAERDEILLYEWNKNSEYKSTETNH